MEPAAPPPPRTRRVLAARAALTVLGLIVLVLVTFVLSNPLTMLVFLLTVAVALAVGSASGWWALTTHRIWKRRANLAVIGLVVLVLLAALVLFGVGNVTLVLTIGLLAALYGFCAARALRIDGDLTDPGPKTAERPVLLINPRSGGGTAGRTGLAGAARDLGIDVRELHQGDDLLQLARDAVAGGADALGMAGGDGSLGLVASVALEHDLPFVCIPAGTRNHFARDLGLNPREPVKALAAFAGPERRIDVGTVGPRVFLNNVSLGVYASIVHTPGYREDKVGATNSVLPATLRGELAPARLTFDGPGGRVYDHAVMVLVANNPYGLIGTSRFGSKFGSRAGLDGGVLQVSALQVTDGASLARAVTLAGRDRLDRSSDWAQWTTTSFTVGSPTGRIEAGIDGEALVLDAPLEFTIRPRALRVLVPPPDPREHKPLTFLLRPVTVNRLLHLARRRPS
jgi:diacylglycerol kinase family enzyme